MLKKIGTVKDWIAEDPSVRLTHPKLQEGVYIASLRFHKKGVKCTYSSHTPEGQPMVPFFGNQCPYQVKGLINYSGYAIHTIFGCGGNAALSNELAEDPHWTEFKDSNEK